MDPLLVVLRLVHVVAGALWVGFALFMSFFLGPALAQVGPEGGKVMAALQRRGIMTVLPLLAILTMIAGLWLYWIRSGGLQPAYVHSASGAVFGMGGLLAIIAFVLGMTVSRPAMMRVGALMQTLPSLSPEERERQMATIGQLRARGARMTVVVAWLLLLATFCMAIARYV